MSVQCVCPLGASDLLELQKQLQKQYGELQKALSMHIDVMRASQAISTQESSRGSSSQEPLATSLDGASATESAGRGGNGKRRKVEHGSDAK